MYFFTPLFVRILGVEGFGLIGVYNALAAVLVMLDFGLSAAATRVVVLESSGGSSTHSVIRTLESIMIIPSVFALGLVLTGSHWLATEWVNVPGSMVDETRNAFALMGVAIGLQLFCTFYSNVLMGLDRQLVANAGLLGQGLIKSAGALMALMQFGPELSTFFLCQVLANAVTVAYYRLSLWQATSKDKANFDIGILKRCAKYSIGLFSLGVISTLSLQVDKVLLSKFVSIELFGFFSLATLIASMPVLVVGPVGAAVFPRFVARFVAGEAIIAAREYSAVCQFASSIASGIAFTILFHPRACFRIFTPELLPDNVVQVILLLTIAQLVQSFTLIPYHFALSYGTVRINVSVGIAMLGLHILLLCLLLPSLGIVAAGASWIAVSLITTLPYMILLHRQVEVPFRLWLGNIVPQAGAAILVSILLDIYIFGPMLEPSGFLLALNAALSIWVAIMLSPDLLRSIRVFVSEQLPCT